MFGIQDGVHYFRLRSARLLVGVIWMLRSSTHRKDLPYCYPFRSSIYPRFFAVLQLVEMLSNKSKPNDQPAAQQVVVSPITAI